MQICYISDVKWDCTALSECTLTCSTGETSSNTGTVSGNFSGEILSNTFCKGKLKEFDDKGDTDTETPAWEVTVSNCEIEVGITSGIAAKDVEVVSVTGILWAVVTVETTGAGTHVQVLPLDEVEAPTSLFCHEGLVGAASAITICFPRFILSSGGCGYNHRQVETLCPIE